MIMKKHFYWLVTAVVVFASCTQSEVLEMAEGRAIGFGSFVNNSTRAVTEIDKSGLTQFNVFGYHGNSWSPDYVNIAVTGSGESWTPDKTAYWVANNAYEFAAYSNGNEALSDVEFAPANKTLTIKGYTVADKDLIAALASKTSQPDVSAYGTVDFNFNHMLSQVKFTFTNTDSRSYTLKISEIKIENAVKTATGTYTASSIDWDGEATGTYTFADIADIAEDGTHAVDLFVIPQSNSNLNVSFKASFYDATALAIQTPLKEGTFTANLNYDGAIQDTEKGNWTPGFRYNYTVEVNADDIDDEGKLTKIDFKVTDVDTWESTGDTSITPQQ